jgi:hypothetical protein
MGCRGYWFRVFAAGYRSPMPPNAFFPADLVRIARLDATDRDVDSVGDPPSLPRLGDMARVVTQVDDDIYLVERTTDDGRSIWTAEFAASELELVERSKGNGG